MCVLAAFTAATAAAWQVVPAAVLAERAGRYVEQYESAFPAFAAEELQVQKLVRPDGRVRETRELRSDFVVVKTAESTYAFRDVLSVNRKPVRSRSERLRRLFVDSPRTAIEQARAIARDSDTHNIGPSRTPQSPLLPLMFLRPGLSSGSRFTSAGATLSFQEVRMPSGLSQRSGSMRLNPKVRGTFQVDPASGRVLTAELTAEGPSPMVSFSMSVRYRLDKALGVMVPVEVRERYWTAGKPADGRLEVQSTYSNFRRFDVPE
jgi:hypothetical protein